MALEVAEVACRGALAPQVPEPPTSEFVFRPLAKLVRLAQQAAGPSSLGSFSFVVHGVWSFSDATSERTPRPPDVRLYLSDLSEGEAWDQAPPDSPAARSVLSTSSLLT